MGIDTNDPGGSLRVARYHIHCQEIPRIAKPKEVLKKKPNFALLRPYFGWAPTNIIKQTMKHSTQYARSIHSDEVLKRHFKSRFPAFNVKRRHEAVATDTVFSDTPAVDDGSTCAQLFVGRDSLFCDVFGMKSDTDFPKALEDVIWCRGAMDLLISDRAQAEVSELVLEILRAYIIDVWQSEADHQHQNFCERRYQTIKTYVNQIMDRYDVPANVWLLATWYICYALNQLSVPSLKYQTPIYKATGEWEIFLPFCNSISTNLSTTKFVKKPFLQKPQKD
jgi:hypothetical protein